jgi:high-affinity nickel-transport protein
MRIVLRFLFSGSSLKSRIIAIYAGLFIANMAAWIWAFWEFHSRPVLLGTCFLAYIFGLRHAVDPDHIAAIDNVTRKLMQEGQRPVAVGLWFALGHSSIVMIGAALIALTAASLAGGQLQNWRDIGGVLSTAISAAFLFLIAFFNILVLLGVLKTFRQVRRTGTFVDGNIDVLLAKRGLLSRMLRPLFGLIAKSWHMYPLGFLFGLGFDTASEIGLFGLSAAEASNGTSLWSIMVFPALFTAGMTLVDTTDGILMQGAYGWAYVKPVRKLFYNLAITFVSVAVALIIGSLEALGLLVDRLQLNGGFWDWVARVNAHFGALGFAIIGLFVAAWLGSWLVYRVGRFDQMEVDSAAV